MIDLFDFDAEEVDHVREEFVALYKRCCIDDGRGQEGSTVLGQEGGGGSGGERSAGDVGVNRKSVGGSAATSPSGGVTKGPILRNRVSSRRMSAGSVEVGQKDAVVRTPMASERKVKSPRRSAGVTPVKDQENTLSLTSRRIQPARSVTAPPTKLRETPTRIVTRRRDGIEGRLRESTAQEKKEPSTHLAVTVAKRTRNSIEMPPDMGGIRGSKVQRTGRQSVSSKKESFFCAFCPERTKKDRISTLLGPFEKSGRVIENSSPNIYYCHEDCALWAPQTYRNSHGKLVGILKAYYASRSAVRTSESKPTQTITRHT